MNAIIWEWVPNKSLGPISIGADISIYIKDFNATIDKNMADDLTGWDSYDLLDFKVRIDVENNKVMSITSYKEFLFKKRNAFDMSVSQFFKLLENSPNEIGDNVEFDDGDIKTPYEFFEIGLQVWASNSVITSITCMTYQDVTD